MMFYFDNPLQACEPLSERGKKFQEQGTNNTAFKTKSANFREYALLLNTPDFSP